MNRRSLWGTFSCGVFLWRWGHAGQKRAAWTRPRALEQSWDGAPERCTINLNASSRSGEPFFIPNLIRFLRLEQREVLTPDFMVIWKLSGTIALCHQR